MKRLSVLFVTLGLLTAACSKDSPTAPSSSNNPVFVASLSPSNEVPPVSGAEAGGSGTVTATFNLTRDSANNITAASVTFNGTFTGFPAGTTLTGAHIHPGVAGVNGGVAISAGLTQGEIVFTNGGGTLNKTTSGVDAALAQTIIGNPAGYYFNIHTAANPSGVARGQLRPQ